MASIAHLLHCETEGSTCDVIDLRITPDGTEVQTIKNDPREKKSAVYTNVVC